MTSLESAEMRMRAAKGAFVTGVAQAYKIVLTFVSGILLARLLTPTDFGLLAMVSSSLAFVGLIQDLGLNQATIQRERISHAQMSALFWLSVGFSGLLTLAVAAFAPVLVWFFRDERVGGLTVAFSFLVVLGGLQSQQRALMHRELRFKALAIIDILTVTASATAGLTVAWLTSSYWALFVASAASSIASVVSVWVLSGWQPGRATFEGQFREIVRFGSSVSGFNVVNYFARNADNLLIGRFYGSEQLGLYDRAYRLLLFPLTQIQGPLGRVMLPMLSRLQSDRERYRKAYFECITLLLTAVQPGLVFATVYSEDLFVMLLGPHWLPAAGIFRWLGICALLQVMTSTSGWLFLSQGRGGDYFKTGLYSSIATVLSFLVGLPWGAIGVAVSYAACNYVILLPVIWIKAGQRGPVTIRDLISLAFPHFVATSAAACVLIGSVFLWPAPGPAGCTLLIGASYLAYVSVIILFPSRRRILQTHCVTAWALRPTSVPFRVLGLTKASSPAEVPKTQ